MKKILSLILAAGLLACALPAHALIPGLYAPVMSTAPTNGTGAGIVLPPSTTNQLVSATLTNGVFNGVTTTNFVGLPGTGTNLALSVDTFDYVGLTWSFMGTATSTNALLAYKSFDYGLTYEAIPSFQYTGIVPGAASFATNASLDVHGVTTLAFVFKNSGTTASSNNIVELNLKSAQLYTIPPGNYGKTPGTPIVVPNFPQ